MTRDAAARLVISRALHRTEIGSQSLTVALSLLGIIAVLRLAANGLIAADIAARGGSVWWTQCASWNALMWLWLSVWIAAPRVAIAVQKTATLSFVRDVSEHRRLLRLLTVRAAIAHPLWVLCTAAAAGWVARALSESVTPVAWVVAGASAVTLTAGASAATGRLLTRAGLSIDLLRGVQALGLLLLVGVMPDVGPSPNGVATAALAAPLPAPAAGLLAGAIAVICCGPAAVAGASHSARLVAAWWRGGRRRNRRRGRRSSSVGHPMLRLYRRLSTGTWVWLFLALIPPLGSRALEPATVRMVGAGFAAAAVVFAVAVAVRMEAAVTRFWPGTLALPSARRVLIAPVVVHAALTATGVAAALVRAAYPGAA